ncbi:MAG: urea carboxylase [Acutalibacteraceae bacterium]|nr:urea carboxylase [Acutalibacteraceae bacterium]
MFTKVLIANRGAIAVRIERTLKKMGIKSVAVYAEADQDSLHVTNADEAVCLGDGPAKDTYLDINKVVEAAVATGAQAVHPGYGFLSENTDFAAACEEKGIRFIGPTSEQIKVFGLKHSARALAESADVPLLPGTGLLESLNEAVEKAAEIGYPVMIKSTAGGGGIGIRICNNEEELRHDYDEVRHLAQANFNDSEVFLEKYVPKARHVEVQIFGNEEGEVAILGERDCSVQRRNQKVVEESPAPNLPEHVRKDMHAAAKRLAKAASYRNAGTVEFLYNEESEGFYFLEVNTRLQVEHGITEEVMGVDLVEWMVKEAAGELHGIEDLPLKAKGHAMEVRVYAEDCVNNFRPGGGKIDEVKFSDKARIETWIRDNIEVTALYDPMLAKLIVYGKDRNEALHKMWDVLDESVLYGVTNNMEYLQAFLHTEDYIQARLYTKMLDGFAPEEKALEVLDGGVQTTVQDYPGIIGYWTVGVPPCGPMDNYSFRIGNLLLGNDEGAAGLEMTLRGGSYRFRTAVSFVLTGADMEATLDKKPVPRYKVIHAEPMQVLKLKSCKEGMRAYLLVAGGIQVSKRMGSSSTFKDGKFGGHNGRALRTGDVLHLTNSCLIKREAYFPKEFQPEIKNTWTLGVIPGPQPTEEFMTSEFLKTLTTSTYSVNFNSARTGVRLNGPGPVWTREDGGEAGLHPSNIHDNPYAIGTMDMTGDQPILLGPDGPSLGGFVCPVTLAKEELWKLGQLHPGDEVNFQLLTLEQAKELRKKQRQNLNFDFCSLALPEPVNLTPEYAVVARGTADGTDYLIRLDGEENILIEFGAMELNIELRFRAQILMNALKKTDLPIIDMTPGIRSLQVHFRVEEMEPMEMVKQVEEVNRGLGALDDITIPSRIIKLPLSWDDPQTQLAAKRYQQTVWHEAPWCPSNPEFIRRINGLDSIEDVKRIVFDAKYLVLGLGDVYLGAPVATPMDPRHRMVTTKYNPARPWTPENAVGIGGAYLCVYGMEGPGGYQFVGRTIQMWNSLRTTEYFQKGKPWLLNFFDQLQFYPCSPEEILEYRKKFLRGEFPIEIEETTFHLKEYKEYLNSIADSSAKFKAHQEAAFEAERQRWHEQGLDHFESDAEPEIPAEDQTIPDGCEGVNAQVPGSVWKMLVKEGDHVEEDQEIAVLESMKMEFPIKSEVSGKVEKVYVNEGEQVQAGQLLAAIRE